jgi:hypothetical protein
MAKNKSIKYAGYSIGADTIMRFRTATTMHRINQLCDLGDTVNMIEIALVNSKSAAAKELLRVNHASGDKDLEAFYTAQVRDENPFAKPKKARTVTIKRTTVADAVMAEAKARFANEDKMSAKEAAKVRTEFNARVKAAYEAN